MKAAIGKQQLLAMVPLSWSTIEALEKAGEFPERFRITPQRVAWNQDQIEQWLDERQAKFSGVAITNHPRANMRRHDSFAELTTKEVNDENSD
ncbi:hypothetical protein BFS14_03640 [Serratia fonticola]|uniref:helix-turn-helix transcriptional regulator n=1 Tax=Serratia TaxID=613 RepID=UPI00080F7733|nr:MULTISPECIES: AlpA family phage regulatory protein [Serratia]MBC3249417.1 AlpA family phage regulatory protein [Serratia fonticola]OCJ22626.1 hypothetical protein A6U95_12595 [Serratia sp. 14-2641]OIX92736.1 hypothetical protein BFS14_03640 [Serratia fonticola]QCR60240.1 AlpA family phage regulatory protein [Serratia fonticola]